MSKQDRSLFLAQIKKSFAGSLNARTLVAILVFGMIIAVFILSDLSGRAGGKGGNLGPGSAAVVNGQIISLKQFQDQETRISNYYAQLFGDQFEKMFQKKQMMSEALSQLVNNAVAEQAATQELLFATDVEIRAAILEIPAFKKEGVFQSDLYKNLLNANRLTPSEFEGSLRQEISLKKVRGLFEASYKPLILEKKIESDLKSAQINIQYIKINRKDLGEEKYLAVVKDLEKYLEKTPNEIDAYIVKNKLKWSESGFFDLVTETVPMINSTTIFKASLELTKQKPYVKNLIHEGDASYLIKLKDTKKIVIADTAAENLRQKYQQKSFGAYQKWVDSYKKTAKIETNNQLLQQAE